MGVQRAWYNNGKLSHEYTYVDGELLVQKAWFDNEKPIYKHNYINEKKEEGIQKGWYGNGQQWKNMRDETYICIQMTKYTQ